MTVCILLLQEEPKIMSRDHPAPDPMINMDGSLCLFDSQDFLLEKFFNLFHGDSHSSGRSSRDLVDHDADMMKLIETL